jgi:hypothetical protein
LLFGQELDIETRVSIIRAAADRLRPVYTQGGRDSEEAYNRMVEAVIDTVNNDEV